MTDPNNLKNITDNFLAEIRHSVEGEKTSLPFIRHTLATHSLVDQDEIFQTLVIGGSFYQKALMKKVNGNIKILKYSQGAQPLFLNEQDLMSFIEKHIDPHVKVVALNFAYPLKPVTRGNVLDGVLASGSKENTFDGLVGKIVGETIEIYFRDKHKRTIKVASANDTICLLLSGLLDHEWNNLAAGIVGTGLNFAIFLDQHTAINLESANFDKFTLSEAARAIDAESVSPGYALYEKEISGAYLYRHFNYLAKQRNLSVQSISATKDLEMLLQHQDKEVAKTAREVLDHSAGLVAVQIAGILEFFRRDITFIMQGSLYWKANTYKETVERIVIDLCPKYHASYEQILHSDLFGAAKLVA